MQWGYEHIKESTSCRTIFEYNDNGKARLAAAQAIETWLACGMGQVIDTGGKIQAVGFIQVKAAA